MDPHSLSLQTAQLSRSRVYNDDLQHYDVPHPSGAPNWACVEVNDNEAYLYDTDIEESLKQQDMRNSDEAEFSTVGMIQSAISNAEKARQGH